MSIFIRKNWKKIILALTAAFWSSCDGDSSVNQPSPQECEGEECIQESSSSSVETPSSSSIESSSSSDINMSVALYGIFYSSSDAASLSSSSEASSSSSNEQQKIYCYKYNGESEITCDDGLTCEEKVRPIYDCTEGPCPLYGAPSSEEKTYKCDNDQTYTEEEFLEDHEMTKPVALYGIFYNSNSNEDVSNDKKN